MTVELVWAETCGARDECPSSNLGCVPSRCHETESRRENVLMSTTCERHAERVRTCFAKVFGKARTDPLEKRDRRRTEADGAEQFSSPCRDHGVPWKHRECQTKLTRVHHHERKQVDAHLQTSDVASHTSVVELEQSAVTQQRSTSALAARARFLLGKHRSHLTRFRECAVTLKCSVLRCGLN